jgi:hypothetical protein
MSRSRRALSERTGDFLIRPWMKILDALWTTALFAITGIVYNSTKGNLLITGGYIVSIFLLISYLRYLAHRAEQRRLERTKQTALHQRLTYERAAEAISPSQSSLFSELKNSILPAPSDEEKRFIETFLEKLLEDLTTRVFEADSRASEFESEKWASQSFKATLMVKDLFTREKFEPLLSLIENDKEMISAEKKLERERYQRNVDRCCMFIKYWYYPGNSHPESLGIPYMINEGVAGLAWFKKSLVIWTPQKSCTPRLIQASNIFAEKYRGQQSKYNSMVCVPIESLDKEKKFLPSSDTKDDGVLGILTITCERKDYLQPEVDFAKYLQTLLAPYVAILSYMLERIIVAWTSKPDKKMSK